MSAAGGAALEPYVSALAARWLHESPDVSWREVDGSLAFVDISGFTPLTERLARRGRVGAEELSDILDTTFAELLRIADHHGGDLIKWGGDAVLLLFCGDAHAARAALAVYRMRARMRRIGRIRTGSGRVQLRMSAGIHSGAFLFALAGDPAVHRELIISGPAASRTAAMEAIADADEIALSEQAVELLPSAVVGPAKGAARLLSAAPMVSTATAAPRSGPGAADLSMLIPPPIRQHLFATTTGQRADRRHGPPMPVSATEAGAVPAGEDVLTGTQMEHRQITVAFVQFCGTDSLFAEHGAAALAAALDECVRVVQRATDRHGVTFFESDINADGGKIMLTAGAPTGSEDDDGRMLRAARAIVEHRGTLSVRVGVNRGPVFTGDFGPPFRRTYSVKGDAVNLAARVMAKAAPGQVLATRAVLEHSQSRFELQHLPPFPVKGKSGLIGAASVGRLVGSSTGDTTGDLISREPELARWRSALIRVQAGRGEVVDLVGDPGIGKSRLTEALLAQAEDAGFAIHSCRCDAYETTTAYWPLRALLRSVLSISADATEQTTRAALIGIARSSMPQIEPWLPLIAAVLDIAMPSTPEVEALAARFHRTRQVEVTTDFLANALTGPVVLAFADVHLMDAASMELLDAVCRAAPEHPWLVLASRRDAGEGFAPSTDYPVSTLRLGPLTAQGSAALVAHLLGDATVTPGDVATIIRRGGGNPLFLRGLVAATHAGAAIGSLPDTVEALISSQIDRLSPHQRSLLRVAAVLGTRFSGFELDVLLQATGLPGEHAELDRLSAFVRADGPDGYAFESQLIRDTAYEGLPYRARQRLHDRAGALIEAAADDPAEAAELLSMHYFHAARADKCWRYSRLAGERAASKFAFVEADELLGRAVATARSLPDIPDDDLASVNTALGQARFRVGRQQQALIAYRAARQHLRGQPIPAADVLGLEAQTLLRAGRHRMALATVSRGLRLLDEAEAADARSDAALTARSRLEGLYAVVRESQGRYRDALSWARRAERHADASGEPAAQAAALEAVHSALSMLGLPQDRPYGELALRLYEQLDDRAGQSRALNNLAVLRWSQGLGNAALDLFRRAEVLANEAGDTAGAAATRYNVGDVLLELGRIVEADDLLQALIPVLRGLGIADFHASTLRAGGLAATLAGRRDEGMALLTQARAGLADLGEATEVVETDAAIAMALLLDGQAEVAADRAAASVRRAEGLHAHHLLPKLLRLQGAACSDAGRLSEAAEALARAADLARVHGQTECGFILAEQSLLASRAGKAADATALAACSRDVLAELGFVPSGRYLTVRSDGTEPGLAEERLGTTAPADQNGRILGSSTNSTGRVRAPVSD